MRSILIRVLVCSAVVLSARAVFALGGFSDTSLIDTDQNQALVQGLQADLVLDRPVLSQSFPKLAAVHFITGSSGQTFDTQENDFADPSGEYCQRYGFTVTSCPSGLFNQACPYNDKIYDKCCDAAYTYTSATCSTPKQLSADTCGGKHRCYCDTAAYPYASCDSPQIKGEACSDESGTRYKTCVCPSPAADTGYGCESYYAAPCGSVCSKYYADNCRNRTHNDYGYGCAKYWDDCAAKCETPYTDNCRNRNAVSAPYGCQQYYSDCQSKCEIAYSDNCRNHTAVISSCPTNATCQTFSDCSSKISSWSCNSGYNQSGNSCVQTCSYASQCPGYTSYGCLDGYTKTPCTACGITKYKCTEETSGGSGNFTSCPGGKKGSHCYCTGRTHIGLQPAHPCLQQQK